MSPIPFFASMVELGRHVCLRNICVSVGVRVPLLAPNQNEKTGFKISSFQKNCRIMCCIISNMLHTVAKMVGISYRLSLIASLRKYRLLNLTCTSGKHLGFIYCFFKLLSLAPVQLVRQHMQHFLCNTSQVQTKWSKCSHYVQ